MTSNLLLFRAHEPIILRPYQEAAIAAVAEAEARGLRRVILALATGTGKTVVAAQLLARRIAATDGRAVFLAHRDELLTQARNKLREYAPELSIGIVRAEVDQYAAQVVVASVQTLVRAPRLRRVLSAGPIGTVIADEMHHYTAGDVVSNTFGRVLEGLGCTIGATNPPLAVGLSATPERADKKPLGSYWQEIVSQYTLKDGIDDGYLCNVRALEVLLKCNFSKLHTVAGDVVAGEASEMLREADAPAHAVSAYLEHAAGRKALVFTPTVDLAEEMSAAFLAAGVAAETVSGRMDLEDRRAVLRRLATGETMVACSCAILTEGFDEPTIDCIILARPTKSRVMMLQMIGRGTRIAPGKTDLLVLDLVAQIAGKDIVSVAQLLRKLKPKGERVGPGGDGSQEEDAEPEPESTKLVHREVDVFGKRHLHWVEILHGYVLNLGKQERNGKKVEMGDVLLQERAPGLYDVVRTWRAEGLTRKRAVVASGLTLEAALAEGEARAHKAGAAKLNAPDARWRRQPATPKQQDLLERLGHWEDGMTMGEAGDALTAFFASRQ